MITDLWLWGPGSRCARTGRRTRVCRLNSRCQTAHVSSFPRRVFCARVFLFWLRSPEFTGWRSAESRRVLARHPLGLPMTRAGQAPNEAPCVPIRGTPASRRSTVAILGSGPALPSPESLPDRSQRAPRVRVVVPGGRGPVPPGAAVANRHRGTPLLAPYSGMPREHAPNEQGWDDM